MYSTIRHFVYAVMSTQKTLFGIFQRSTAKPSQTSSTGQKESLMKILRRFRDPRKEDIADCKFNALIDYVLGERTQDKLSNNKVQFITLFSGFVSV